MSDTRFVDFEKYCETCAYWEKKDTDKPCDECLGVPVREDSHKPVNWKEKSKDA